MRKKYILEKILKNIKEEYAISYIFNKKKKLNNATAGIPKMDFKKVVRYSASSLNFQRWGSQTRSSEINRKNETHNI